MMTVTRLASEAADKQHTSSVAMDAAADGQDKARTCGRHRVNDYASRALLYLGLASHASRVIYDDNEVTK